MIVAHRDAAARGAARSCRDGGAARAGARVRRARDPAHDRARLHERRQRAATPARRTSRHSPLAAPFDAAIVLGDLAAARRRKPLSCPTRRLRLGTGCSCSAPSATRSQQRPGLDPGAPSALGQLAHLAFPLTVGEQGPLNAAGIPRCSCRSAANADPRRTPL